MKQVIVRKGEVVVEEVAPPMIEPGTILVRVETSTVSVGTELSGIRASATPLWKRAVHEPEKVRRVINVAARDGLGAARDLVGGAHTAGVATGYSAAGTAIEIGSGVGTFRAGDRVACAGAQSAHHAELIRVPENLTTRIPEGVSVADASTVTLGAIALQGVRRARPTLGETFVVVGLGVLGQLSAQLLRANGCRVIGVDLDHMRTELARSLGMDAALTGDPETDSHRVERLTGGAGSDGVIITASSESSDLLSQAFRMTRRKGRVVIVGDVGMDIERADIYEKELDVLISTSYGPGRYDQRYEEHGLDYPLAYVRWTENRNMQEYLRLLSTGGVDAGALVSRSYPLEQAADAYVALRDGSPRPVLVQLDYPLGDVGPPVVVHRSPVRAQSDSIGVAVVGAGAFAKAIHLPSIRAMSDALTLRTVVGRSGPSVADVARRFGAQRSTTDVQEALDDDEVELVVIATRHDSHAELTLRALRAGKHVLVEKPLALSRSELGDIEAFFADREPDSGPLLLTGFNRRFSRYAREARRLVAGRTAPMIVNYQMNAGYIAGNHWVQSSQGGGRNLGEACHIYDLFTYLTGARATAVEAMSIDPPTSYYGRTDNFVATVKFEDGSVANLAYTSLGSSAVSKERMDIYVDGQVIQLDDFRRLEVTGGTGRGITTPSSEKGHREEVESLVVSIRGGGEWPISLWEQVQATTVALDVEDRIRGA